MSEIKPCPELVEAKAEIVYQAKLLIKLRRKIAMFVHDIEDEGDRAYFGSTNDADDLRTLYAELDEFDWSRMEKNRKGRDLYAELRAARRKVRELEADRDRASDACASVQRERDALREMLGEAVGLLRNELGTAEIATVMPETVGKVLVRQWDDPGLDNIRAFLARYEALK